MAKTGLGIDLGADSLKIVLGRFKGDMFQVLRARRIRLPRSEDPLGQVQSVLEAEGWKGRGLLGLTGKDIIIRYTQVPPVTPQRLKTLMDFEVGEIINQSGGDVVADYALLPLDEGSDEEDLVLLGLVKDTFLGQRVDVLKRAGIHVDGACPNALALFNCFLKNGDFRSEEVTLLLNIGAENCDIALQKNAQLIFARNQSLGGQAFTRAIVDGLGVDEARAEKLKQIRADLAALLPGAQPDQDAERLARTLVGPAGRLFSTIQSTLTFAKNQSKIYNLKLGRVLLTGGGSRLRGLDAYLAQNLGVPVEHFDPVPSVDVSALAPESSRDMTQGGPEMAVALGLAQMAVDPRFFRITLLPEKMRKLMAFKKSTAFMIAAGVLVVLFAVFSFLEARTENVAAASWAATIAKENSTRQRNLRQFNELRQSNVLLRAKVDQLARRANFGPALVKAWQAVEKHLPHEFWIKEMKLDSRPMQRVDDKAGKKTATNPVVNGRRGRRDEVNQGPELPVLVVVGAGRQTGRQLVPVLNQFKAVLGDEPDIKYVHREDKIGAGKLEFTLFLYLVAPPDASPAEESSS